MSSSNHLKVLPFISKDLMYTLAEYTVADPQIVLFSTKKSSLVPFSCSVIFPKHMLYVHSELAVGSHISEKLECSLTEMSTSCRTVAGISIHWT